MNPLVDIDDGHTHCKILFKATKIACDSQPIQADLQELWGKQGRQGRGFTRGPGGQGTRERAWRAVFLNTQPSSSARFEDLCPFILDKYISYWSVITCDGECGRSGFRCDARTAGLEEQGPPCGTQRLSTVCVCGVASRSCKWRDQDCITPPMPPQSSLVRSSPQQAGRQELG